MGEKSFRFARNVSWTLLGQGANSVLNFLLTPYIIAHMGVEMYGLYLLFHTATGYLTLSSLGAGAATYKYVAQFNGARDDAGVRETVKYSLWMHCLGALVVAALLGVGAEFFAVRVFYLQGKLIEAGIFVLRAAAGAAIFLALIQVALSALMGLQRFDYHNILTFTQTAILPLGVAGLLYARVGIRGILSWYVFLTIGIAVLSLWLLGGFLRPAPENARPRLGFASFFHWSLSQWLVGLAWIITYNTDKIFIARALSLSSLTLYAVPAALLARLQLVPGAVTAVAMPIMSELSGPDAEERLRRMYLKSLRFLLWLMVPAFALLFAVMPQFLTLWLGGDFSWQSTQPARFLILAQVFLMLTAMPSTVVNVKHKPWYLPTLNWAQALISLVAWRLLIPRYGLMGVAAGSLLAQALPGCVYAWVVHKRLLGLSLGRFVKEGLLAPAASAVLMLAVVFPFHSLATDWARLAGFLLAGSALYYGSTWFWLSGEDRALLLKFLRRQTA